MESILMIALGGFALFMIIAGAVKMAVKEALYDFKEDIAKELSFKKVDSIENKED